MSHSRSKSTGSKPLNPASALAPQTVTRITLVPDGRPKDVIVAESHASPVTMNAITAAAFTGAGLQADGCRDMDAPIAVLRDMVERVKRGDLSDVAERLFCSGVTLDVASNDLIQRGRNLIAAGNLNGGERLYRLAFAASGRSTSAFQSLVELKNPRPVFVQQANIAHGPQQVNNDGATKRAVELQSPREEISHNPSNKLLEIESGERLDPVPARKTG